jgi:signal transduction histidine kinase
MTVVDMEAIDAGGEEESPQHSRTRFAFLAETSRCLSHSLDFQSTLETVAGLALPHFGTWCMVDIIEADGTIRRVAVIHPDAAKQAVAREYYEVHPPCKDDPIGAPRVIRTSEDAAYAAQRAEALRAAADAARTEAETANKSKEYFLATLSHEFRTPLGIVLGYVGLLNDEVAGPINEGQRKQLQRISTASTHLLRLIEEILTLSKMNAGRGEPNIEMVDLSALLRDAVALLAPMAEAKRLTLALELPEVPLVFPTDPGIGISQDDADHLFESYWQVRQSSPYPAGTGLGFRSRASCRSSSVATCRWRVSPATEHVHRPTAAAQSRRQDIHVRHAAPA